MTITLTDKMWEMWYKIEPYLIYDKGNRWHFKDDTPEEIIKLNKELDKLHQEQHEFELRML